MQLLSRAQPTRKRHEYHTEATVEHDDEKTHLSVHGQKCFATGHEIAVDEDVHFDPRAFSMNGHRNGQHC